jgi:uncharacterized protein
VRAFPTSCSNIQAALKASIKSVFFPAYHTAACKSRSAPSTSRPGVQDSQQLPLLTDRYGVETLEMFGSYVRAEQKADSDLDLLVTFREEPSLLTFIAIENYLSDTLGVKVDLVMKDSLRPAIGAVILNEAVPL